MPGVPGKGGRIPRRGEVRGGHYTKEQQEAMKPQQVVALGAVEIPDHLGFDAYPLVIEFFESVKSSGQAQFYEPSDWTALKFVCFQMNEHIKYMMKTGKVNSNSFSALWSAMNDLLVTEGSRRRVKMEIDRNQSEAEVFDFQSAYAEMLGVKKN